MYLAIAACDSLQLDWPEVGEEVLLPETESPRLVAAALALSHRLLRRGYFLKIVTSDEVFISGPGAEITCVSKEPQHRTLNGIDKRVIRLSAEQSEFDGAGTVLIDAEKEPYSKTTSLPASTSGELRIQSESTIPAPAPNFKECSDSGTSNRSEKDFS